MVRLLTVSLTFNVTVALAEPLPMNTLSEAVGREVAAEPV